MNVILSFLLAGALGASAQMPAAGLTPIGAAASVRGRVNATVLGETVGRVMGSGKPLYLYDHVTTDAAGRLQVLLLDETVFTVGPNSDMVLDEFVYDPASNNGKVTARITKGVFRFVTGKVARKDPASMKVILPVGTIGIRGTIAAGRVSDKGVTVVLLGPGSRNDANENSGAVSVFNSRGRAELTQPGFGTTIAPDAAPTRPVNMSQQLQQMLSDLGMPPSRTRSSGSPAPGASPTRASGQGTAAGGALANLSGENLGVSQSANATQQVGAQTQLGQVLAEDNTSSPLPPTPPPPTPPIPDGTSTWDQVRSITTGTGFYGGSGSFSCSGGACGTGATTSGGLTFGMNVDFGNRTVGGGASFVQLNGTGLSDSTSLAQTSFANLTGNAVVTLSAASGNSSNSSFDSTTLSLQNNGGLAAKTLTVSAQYLDSVSGLSASGSANGAFQSNTSASAPSNGPSTWQQVSNVQAGMIGYYSGSGAATISNVYGYTGAGTVSFNIDVSFAARTIGGGGSSNIQLDSPSNILDTTIIGTSGGYSAIPFGTTGNARIVLSNALSPTGNITNGAFNGTAVSFQNTSGVAAQNLAVNLAYSGNGGTATGSAAGTFTQTARLLPLFHR
jgi:hypothetical protein